MHFSRCAVKVNTRRTRDPRFRSKEPPLPTLPRWPSWSASCWVPDPGDDGTGVSWFFFCWRTQRRERSTIVASPIFGSTPSIPAGANNGGGRHTFSALNGPRQISATILKLSLIQRSPSSYSLPPHQGSFPGGLALESTNCRRQYIPSSQPDCSHVTAHQPLPSTGTGDPQQAAGFHSWQSFYITRYIQSSLPVQRRQLPNKTSTIARSPVPKLLAPVPLHTIFPLAPGCPPASFPW